MSIQPQFESYRYIGEVCRLRGQSIVECRLPGSEISSILAVHAKESRLGAHAPGIDRHVQRLTAGIHGVGMHVDVTNVIAKT